ncbi:MAG: chemotaxis protein CheB [Gracilimonas sp.]|uniref:chemotaxis protein CheB n=1 Tax=Gracilimonas sp. TaxID=1974203 RepID=UPI0019C05EDF|nr:chemotaxis protein CheB [Gracilimonas sp.]MBD3616290.1 chemotaxis protein CheB [Gracilimonas sp.]
MENIKALIIDDNILERRVLSNMLKSFNGVEVRNVCDSEDIYTVIENEKFDVVFFDVQESRSSSKIDIEMLRAKYPSLLVVAIAKRTEKGAIAILNALNRGAVDFITNPEKNNMLLLAKNHFQKRLGLIIENIREIKSGKQRQGKLPLIRKNNRQKADIVVIGTGSEGIRTLYKIFSKISGNISVPVVMVPHLPKIFTGVLAESLNRVSKLKITEAADRVKLEPRTVYVVPGGFHAEVIREDSGYSLRLHKGPKENGVRPSIDVVFRSISRIFREKALGVLLNGYGHDGFMGAQLLKENGGEILILQPDSLFAGALLNDIYNAGLSDQVCFEEFLSWEIIKRVPLEKRNAKKGFVTVPVIQT